MIFRYFTVELRNTELQVSGSQKQLLVTEILNKSDTIGFRLAIEKTNKNDVISYKCFIKEKMDEHGMLQG